MKIESFTIIKRGTKNTLPNFITPTLRAESNDNSQGMDNLWSNNPFCSRMAGSVYGLTNCIGNFAGFLVPIAIGNLTPTVSIYILK